MKQTINPTGTTDIIKYIIQKPFAGYKDFEDCVNRNKDKSNPEAYCGAIKYKVEKYMGEQSDKEIEEQFHKELINIFNTEIDGILKNTKRLDRDAISALVSNITNQASAKMKNHSDKFIKSAYESGMKYVESLIKSAISFTKVDEYAINAITDSGILWDSYSGMQKSLSDKINNIILESYKDPTTFSINNMVKKMKEAANDDVYLFSTIARTETHTAAMTGRYNSFKKSDPENKNLYKWAVRHDNRTSAICSSIEKQVELEGKGKGVPLDRLTEILKENTIKFMGNNWVHRDWTVHPNCRSGLTRIV